MPGTFYGARFSCGARDQVRWLFGGGFGRRRSDRAVDAPGRVGDDLVTPFTVGMRVIEAIAEGIADAVEMIATPAPITVPAPHAST
jgi:hypothetical protein